MVMSPLAALRARRKGQAPTRAPEAATLQATEQHFEKKGFVEAARPIANTGSGTLGYVPMVEMRSERVEDLEINLWPQLRWLQPVPTFTEALLGCACWVVDVDQPVTTRNVAGVGLPQSRMTFPMCVRGTRLFVRGRMVQVSLRIANASVPAGDQLFAQARVSRMHAGLPATSNSQVLCPSILLSQALPLYSTEMRILGPAGDTWNWRDFNDAQLVVNAVPQLYFNTFAADWIPIHPNAAAVSMTAGSWVQTR